ncbi:MAG: 2-succinyl-5-enolpyruvyl-6-hydroxy-3-cyclohexene-1-carboxylic-acid synthase [Deltaproteobacteria bacterium]|nr:2-succinyl-5-enolpyruvyl-6-hydroxy-3-cyclohexene-1-carboxylic-acid synthase [Deltaproteobacteria bacterium]
MLSTEKRAARSTNEAWCRAIVDELVHHGLRHAVVAPGSRSAPMALALAEREIEISVVVDERSAAFFALGLAKGARQPVLVLCTSGSAGAHFLPAIIEAHTSGVPLVVVTADRPPELHGFGAHQSIDQTRLFGAFADFVDLGAPHSSPEALRHVRALAARAMSAGSVVHWNAPFREPLAPPDDVVDHGLLDPGFTAAVHKPELRATSATLALVRDAFESALRPLFIVGPIDDPALRAPLLGLARRLGAPVLAEISSGLRNVEDADVVVDHAELIVRAGIAPIPDLVVRLGGTPTTRAMMAFAGRSPRTVVVGATADPGHSASVVVCADPATFLRELEPRAAVEPGWLASWKDLDARATSALQDIDRRRGPALDEPAIARAVVAAVAAGDVLVLASSMPIRDAETFGGHTAAGVRVVVNRGVAGIDGLVSTMAGLALATGRATTLLCGDLSFLHDIGGLITARMAAAKGARMTIVVVNNDGGGIFSFLPVAARTSTSIFTQLFGTPHGLTFASAAAFVGATYAQPETVEALQLALQLPGFVVVEVRTDRLANRALHDDLFGEIAGALR